jgi:hypothetical protein
MTTPQPSTIPTTTTTTTTEVQQSSLEQIAQLLLQKRGKLIDHINTISISTLTNNNQPITTTTTSTTSSSSSLSSTTDQTTLFKLNIELAKEKTRLSELQNLVRELEQGKGGFEITTVDVLLEERASLEETIEQRLQQRKKKRGLVSNETTTTSEEIVIENQDRLNAIILDRGIKRIQLNDFAEQMKIFRLGGISCFSVAGREEDLGLRFESTSDGFYLDRHYVILSKNLSVHRHGLPFFIPIRDIEKQFLPHNPMGFAKRVSRYLHAWCARDVANKRLSYVLSSHNIQVKCSTARDVMTISPNIIGYALPAKCGPSMESLQFIYTSLLDIVPSKAILIFSGHVVGETYNLEINITNTSTLVQPFNLVQEFQRIMEVVDWDEV